MDRFHEYGYSEKSPPSLLAGAVLKNTAIRPRRRYGPEIRAGDSMGEISPLGSILRPRPGFADIRVIHAPRRPPRQTNSLKTKAEMLGYVRGRFTHPTAPRRPASRDREPDAAPATCPAASLSLSLRPSLPDFVLRVMKDTR